MKRLLIAAMAMLVPFASQAEGMLQWQDNSLSYLYGTNYKLASSETQQTLTFEHASGWSVGDLFIFVDGTKFNGASDTSYYGEFSPRFSLGKVTGNSFAFGPIKDVLVATTYEFGEGDVETLLLGAGVDLDIPLFDYLQLNVYQRIPKGSRDGDTIQITPVWKMTFPVGNSAIVFDGFIDWVVNSDGGYRSNLHINPQVKYDLGVEFGMPARTLLVGAELDYWKNKYGVDIAGVNSDQKTGSLIVKYHF